MTENCTEIIELSQGHCCKPFYIIELPFKKCGMKIYREKSFVFKRKIKDLIFFYKTESCFDAYREIIIYSTIHKRHVIKVCKLLKYVFQHYKIWES